MSGAISLLPQYAFVVSYSVKSTGTISPFLPYDPFLIVQQSDRFQRSKPVKILHVFIVSSTHST